MQISDVFLGMGQEDFGQLVRGISIGKLRTYQIYEGFKVRAHLHKLNTETLRKATPRFWARIGERDDAFATDISQAVLVSHLDLVGLVLDELGVPHDNGFFSKEMDPKPYFSEGWEQRVYQKFHGSCPDALLIFYINHLRWELLAAEDLFRPVPASQV
jgi:hypothetical protein